MLYNSPFIYHIFIYSTITSMGNLFILYSSLVLFLHLFILLTLHFILNLIIYPFYPIHPLLHHYSDYSFISFFVSYVLSYFVYLQELLPPFLVNMFLLEIPNFISFCSFH